MSVPNIPQDKPLHPAAVHFPIAFLSLSFGLDALYGLTSSMSLPTLVSYLPAQLEMTRASHFLLSL
ncbi:hypothetical protein LTR28_000094, partial [Elasticomyces elasticus]